MNRRIGRLIRISLFAALPLGWSAAALAQGSAGSAVPGDTGINPDNPSSLTKDQKKAGDIDQNLGNPNLEPKAAEPGVGNKSDTMGTSGSSGSMTGPGEKKDQSGSQMGGSAGAVHESTGAPKSIDTKEPAKATDKKVDEKAPKLDDALPKDSADHDK